MNADSNTQTESPFYALAPKDQKFVINLCEDYTYREALKILARPRPEGLALEASHTNLRRFFVQWHPLPHKFKIKSQLVEALDEKFFDTGEVYFRAIIALVQQLVFNALQDGATLEQSTSNLRLMLSLRIHYHKHLQMRADFKSPNRLIEDVPDKYLEADSYEKAEPPAEPQPQVDDPVPPDPASAAPPVPPAPATAPATASATTPPPGEPQTTTPPAPEIPPLSRQSTENSTGIPTENDPNSALSTNSTTDFPPATEPIPNPTAQHSLT